MSQGGSKLQIENLTHALQHAQDLSKCNSKLHKCKKWRFIASLMGEGFMGGVHPPLRSFMISDFVL